MGGSRRRSPRALALIAVVLGVRGGDAARASGPRIRSSGTSTKLRTDETPSQRCCGRRWRTLGMGDVSAGYIGNNGVLLVDSPEQADPSPRR